MRPPMFGRFSSSFTNIGSSSSWFEVYASFSAFMMILRTVFNDLIPLKLQIFITSKLQSFFSNYQPKNQVSLQIEPLWDGSNNNLFYAAKEYLPTRISKTYKSLKVGKISDHNNLLLAFDGKQPVVDEFEGIKITWMLTQKTNNVLENPNMELNEENLYGLNFKPKPKETGENAFVLSFDEKHRDKVMEKYIPHVLSTYEAMQGENRTLKIYSLRGGWQQSNFNHPASFDSLALDPDLKNAIIDDLDRFLRRKKMYKKVGKPWKRGYLLYGPPGTGKSTLVAAMAKYLKFDVYDLDLSLVSSNSVLTSFMRNTSNKSIIVIEDIDCNKEVLNRSRSDMFSDTLLGAKVHFMPRTTMDLGYGETQDFGYAGNAENAAPSKFTLSGLLNYMDGLWSCCGEERIIIFTTNHKDKVDPALLRPGRMDMHIHLSFLKAKAFRILASNYLDIEEHHHPLLEEIEELLEKLEVTPAVVAEHLLRSEDADVALKALVKFLQEIEISGGKN